MSFAGDIARAVRDVLLYSEKIDRLERDLRDLSGGIAALAAAQTQIDIRVNGLEQYLRGRADQAAETRRLT